MPRAEALKYLARWLTPNVLPDGDTNVPSLPVRPQDGHSLGGLFIDPVRKAAPIPKRRPGPGKEAAARASNRGMVPREGPSRRLDADEHRTRGSKGRPFDAGGGGDDHTSHAYLPGDGAGGSAGAVRGDFGFHPPGRR